MPDVPDFANDAPEDSSDIKKLKQHIRDVWASGNAEKIALSKLDSTFVLVAPHIERKTSGAVFEAAVNFYRAGVLYESLKSLHREVSPEKWDAAVGTAVAYFEGFVLQEAEKNLADATDKFLVDLEKAGLEL